MRKHTELTLKRIKRFHQQLKASYYYNLTPMKTTIHKSSEPISWEVAQKAIYEPIEPGELWGKDYDCAWFKFEGIVPQEFKGKYTVALIDVGGEACLFDKEGNPIQGLTNKRIEWTMTETIIKKRVHLFDPAEGGEKVSLMIDAGANNILGIKNVLTYTSMVDGIFNQADLAVFDREKWHLRLDVELLLQMAEELPEYTRHRRLILYALNEACNAYGEGTTEEIALCREILKKELDKPANASALKVSAIGHAHIDVAWLWPIRETVRKTARTFSTAIDLMNAYPDYKFGASQPVLYEFIKKAYPGLYSKVKEAVRNGQWECQGSMWVEADCNLSGGEALVRQTLYGKRFYLEEFGFEVKNLWLPDVFGYAASLPQLMKKADVDYFMSQKISWNQFNKFPHHTFSWQGIDGTQIFTHFLAPNNYRSDCSAMDLINLERNNNDIDRTEHALFLYGAGDGGGGPSRVYLEKLKRVKDLEDMPKVTLEFAETFFEKAESTAFDLQKWQGELYLELHRGTLTTQALTKKLNRKLEFLFREVEALYALYALDQYPLGQLNELWKVLLMNQFHDILPGTSTHRVHQECLEQYFEIQTELYGLKDQLIKNKGNSIFFFNSLIHSRTEALEVPVELVQNLDHQVVDSEKAIIQARIPALGFFDLDQIEIKGIDSNSLKASSEILENELIKIEFTGDGTISSIYDKDARREVVSAGQKANHFVLYEDKPNLWDAWDLDIFYEETKTSSPALIRSEALETGPIRAKVRFCYQSKLYSIIQDVQITSMSKQIDFITKIEWAENEKMLRAEFPVDIISERATFEIQYGHVPRSTHYNTSWDMAQFEVNAHKWADLSHFNYGVALLNDCKYGHKIKGNVISLNLLRSPKEPDPVADMHSHEFTYSLLPHKGNRFEGEVIQKAYQLNIPVTPAFDIPFNTGSLLQIDQPNIIVESIKKAEDSDELILRLYESYGIHCMATMQFGMNVKKIELVNLMERHLEDLNLKEEQCLELKFGMFEIHTLKLSV